MLHIAKPLAFWGILLSLLLNGCASPAARVDTLRSWSFQYNEGTDDYSVFFGLADKSGDPLAVDINADIRIVNDKSETVYSGTRAVSVDDYSYYTSTAAGEQYLANVRIPAEAIAPGTTSSGTVYLTVYKENEIDFGEVNCDASYCLPLKDITVTFDDFPLDLTQKDYFGRTESVIQIQDAAYEFDKDFYLPTLSVTIWGEKLSGSGISSSDTFNYELYDSAGYLVKSGHIFLFDVNAGTKFKDDSVEFYDLTPGETYTLHLGT